MRSDIAFIVAKIFVWQVQNVVTGCQLLPYIYSCLFLYQPNFVKLQCLYLGTSRTVIVVMIKDRYKIRILRSSLPEVFFGKGVMKLCNKFTGEFPYRGVISIKLLRNFIEIALRYGCYPVNLLHIFRTSFYKNTSGRLLLSTKENHNILQLDSFMTNVPVIFLVLVYLCEYNLCSHAKIYGNVKFLNRLSFLKFSFEC